MKWILAIMLPLLSATAPEPRLQTETDPHEGDGAWLYRQTDLLQAGEFPQAREQALVQLRAYKARNDLQGQAACLSLIATAELAMGRREDAGKRFEDALSLLELAKDHFVAAGVARTLGRLHTDEDRFQEAEQLYRRAIDWIRELREDGQLGRLTWHSVFHADLNLPYVPPKDWLNDPAAVSRTLSQAEAALRGSFGETLFMTGRLEKAEGQFRQVLELVTESEALGHPHLSLGLIQHKQGLYAEARQSYESALEVLSRGQGLAFGGLEGRRLSYMVYERLAVLSSTEGKPEEALSWIEEAQSAARRSGESDLEAAALRERASILRQQGRHREAREALETAGRLLQVTSHSNEEAHRLFERAVGELATGSYEQALMHLAEAASLPDEAELECSSAMSTVLLSIAYWNLGAQNLAEHAAEAVARSRCPEGRAAARLVQKLTGEGVDGARLGELMEDVESLMQDFGFPSKVPYLTSLGTAMRMLAKGDLHEAERLLTPALRIAIESRQADQELGLRSLRGFIAYRRQDLKTAKEDWEAALRVAQQLKDPTQEAILLAQLGRLHWWMGERQKGLEQVRQSVEKVEGLAADFEVDPLLVSFLGEQTLPFGLLVEMLFEAGRPEEAFAAAERARAQALMRLLDGIRPRGLAGAPAELLAEARRLRSRIRELEDELRRGGRPLDRLRQDLQEARRGYEELLVRAQLAARGREREPAASGEERAEWSAPLGIVEVQRLLPADTALVSFFVDSSRVVAWVVDRQGADALVTGMSRADLAEGVGRFRRAIAGETGRPLASNDKPSRGAVAVGASLDGIEANWQEQRIALGAELYDKLISPLKPFLDHRRLILVPHDALHYLPFAALQDPESDRFLIEDYSLTYSPSATTVRYLGMAPQPLAGGLAVVLGDPMASDPKLSHLAGARAEALAIAELLEVAPFLGLAASERRLRELSSGATLLHLAAHGVYVEEEPLFSHLALTPDEGHDGKLEVTEVFEELDLSRGPLVVLSACQTALGEHSGGDEVVGLVRAFLAAGSPAVMATLWEIDDESSALLMRDFYRRLLDGEPAVDALREAQLGIFRNHSAAPFFWAAFGLTGGLPTPAASTFERSL